LNETADYYSLLGLARSATAAEIKSAYRKLVFRYHPDRNPDDQQAAEKLKQVLQAYDVLSDKDKRANYDQATRPAAEEKPEEEQQARGEQWGDNVGSGFKSSYEFKQKAEPEPRCPKCAVVGIDHIVSRKGGTGTSRGKQFIVSPYHIIFCIECGHVYGVIGAP
jgi:curved DNA-binding protein CbpA